MLSAISYLWILIETNWNKWKIKTSEIISNKKKCIKKMQLNHFKYCSETAELYQVCKNCLPYKNGIIR